MGEASDAKTAAVVVFTIHHRQHCRHKGGYAIYTYIDLEPYAQGPYTQLYKWLLEKPVYW